MYYLVKYALTSGIEEIEATSKFMLYYIIGVEVMETKEKAIKKAEEMRLKKIKSLEKQLIKYKNLRFEL